MERYTESQGFPFLKRNVTKCWQKKNTTRHICLPTCFKRRRSIWLHLRPASIFKTEYIKRNNVK